VRRHQRDVDIARLPDRLAVVDGLQDGELPAALLDDPSDPVEVLRAIGAYAVRAAATAASTSASPASTTSASTSSVAGFTVLRVSPDFPSTKSPLTNSPYDDRMSTIEGDSGAGA
jgi:hypothetical protein